MASTSANRLATPLSAASYIRGQPRAENILSSINYLPLVEILIVLWAVSGSGHKEYSFINVCIIIRFLTLPLAFVNFYINACRMMKFTIFGEGPHSRAFSLLKAQT